MSFINAIEKNSAYFFILFICKWFFYYIIVSSKHRQTPNFGRDTCIGNNDPSREKCGREKYDSFSESKVPRFSMRKKCYLCASGAGIFADYFLYYSYRALDRKNYDVFDNRSKYTIIARKDIYRCFSELITF